MAQTNRPDRRLEELDMGGMAARYGSYVTLSAEAAVSLGSMEGMFEAAPPAESARPAWSGWSLAPGYLIAAAVTVLGFSVASSLPDWKVSATMMAIILGVAVRNLLPLPATTSTGCKDIVKRVIPIAILCIGAELDLIMIAEKGLQTALLTVGCVLLAFALGYYVARWMGLNHKTSLLLGSGTAICGSSAIAATAPLIEAEDDDMLLAIGTVNLVGLLAMLALPLVAVALGLGAKTFGYWCGTSIHAVPQVMAAADSLKDLKDATGDAILVKMGRVALLAPLVFVLALGYTKRSVSPSTQRKVANIQYAKLVPWFIWAFVAVALLHTSGLLPTLQFHLIGAKETTSVDLSRVLSGAGKILLALAMAAIGLTVNLRALLSVGGRSLAAGVLSSILLAACSLLLIRLLI